MEFALSPAAAAIASEVRAFLAEYMTPELRDATHESGVLHDDAFYRALAAKGWLASALPGSDVQRDPFEMATIFNELERADAPFHAMATTLLVAGVMSVCAADTLREEVLPRLLAGDALVSLGYSEPDSGSDVAAARTKAVPLDDAHSRWRIDGQKMWTSLAQVASYVLLLARTNPNVPKHKGLTMFLVPLDTPGVTIMPIHTMGDEVTNTTFYDGVEIDDRFRVGEVDGGWSVMGVALAYERGVVGGVMEGVALYEAILEWARTGPPGERPIDTARWREALARARIDNEVSWLLGQRSAWLAAIGAMPSIEGSIAKLFTTTALQRHVESYQRLAGPVGLLRAGDPEALARGALDRAARHAPVTTIYGGTSEIQRNNIAERLLGLPKAR